MNLLQETRVVLTLILLACIGLIATAFYMEYQLGLEPCPMCAGALVQARVGQVIFGARDPKRGGLGGTIDLSAHPSAHHHMVVTGGVMESEASALLEHWFRQRRRRPAGTEAARSRTG